MQRWNPGFIVICVSLLVGCAHGYQGSRRHWTKENRSYEFKNFEAQLIWRTTYFSDGFRRLYEEQHVRLNHLGPVESARWLADQEKDHQKYHEFFVNFYTQRDYKDFSTAPNSFWKVVLITEGKEEVAPTAIELVEIDPYYQKMFPDLNRWSKGYRVLFPKVALGRKVTLALRSVLGESSLHWRLP